VIALSELVLLGAALGWLIYGAAPWRWGIAATAGVAGSILVNMNTFPLMAWYTIDGLLLVSAGLILIAAGVARGSRIVWLIGFLVVGVAAATKQSFVPATAFAWLLLIPILRAQSWRTRALTLLVTGIMGSLPLLTYLSWISIEGGFEALRSQLLGGAAFVYGRPLVSAWKHDFLALALVAVATTLLTARLERQGRKSVDELGSLGARITLTVLIVAIPLWSRLGLDGAEWGIRVLWALIAYAATVSLFRRSIDPIAVVIVGIAWMSSLSYGYAWPNLVAGSMALYILNGVWRRAPAPSFRWIRDLGEVKRSTAAIALLAVTVVAFWQARTTDVYLDRPASDLTASLGMVAPAFGDIHTNPNTAAYLAQMVQCIREHPAREVAVLPENAAMYPALQLDNPFPIDWMWPDSFHGSEARVAAVADVLNRQGNYLVMFQTVDEPQLVHGSTLPDASPTATIASFSPVPAEIYARLNGQRLTCGSFLAVYAPPAS
jgi:hypothetical protein